MGWGSLRVASFQIDDAHLELDCRWRLSLDQRFINFKVRVQSAAFFELRVTGRLEFNISAHERHVARG